MTATKKISRKMLSMGAATLIVLALVYAFWPQATLVDIGKVTQGAMQVTVNEEAHTQVTELYTVSAPISGHLLRTTLKSNDVVEQQKTIVARILPSSLSNKEAKQAQAVLQAAQASIAVAQAALTQAQSQQKLAHQQAKRSTQQINVGAVSVAENEQTQQQADYADAALASAQAVLSVRRAELANAKAALIGANNTGVNETVDVVAPISGKVLRVIEESEKTLAVGAPILEIGDIANGLEVAVELLSSDAVQVQKGQRVIISNWGSDEPLQGVISRIDPLGFIKTSALGVEERRVKAIIQLQNLPSSASNLGHGFRVDVAIVIWEKTQTIKVPASALFRENGQWTVFVVNQGKAQLRQVSIENNNGTEASVLKGLQLDERVILYPTAVLSDGLAVVQR